MTDNRVVVVTGAGAGVGRAVALAFGGRGASVGLVGRDQSRLESAAGEITAAGGKALVLPADVAAADQVEAAADSVEAALGPIHVWVNNAMTSVFAGFLDISAEEYERVTDVTYHGYVNGTRAALQRMVPRDRGVVVQVGSALAYRGIPMQSAYCGAKHAIGGFTDSVRCELLNRKSAVQVVSVHLPALNTPQFDWVLSRLPNRPQPVPPIYQPELIAEAVVAMSERPRREMWLGGSTVMSIALNRVVPGVLDRYLAAKGVAGQQTDEPADPARPANLWAPVPGPWAAHGPFDDRAVSRSVAMWASIHRRTLSLLACGSIAVAGLFRGAWRKRP